MENGIFAEVPRRVLSEFAFTCDRPIDPKEKEFETRSRSIFSGVSAFLKRDVRTNGIWKIGINVNSKNDAHHMKVVGGVLRYNIRVDIDSFFELGIEDQKNWMLTLIEKTLLVVFNDAGFDVERLNGLRDFIIKRGYKSTFTGPTCSRNGVAACVVCEQGFERTVVFIVFKKADQEFERAFVLETSPEEFIFNVYLKAPEWISDTDLKLDASNGETYIVSL
ncbi:MAG: hypothetical protein GY807_01375 [Gammaproteobacteria bacterium]|nr:hypothetical protein [Gammaproteobacteria bacterium]